MVIEIEAESDGRFRAEISAIPGAVAYGATAKEAIARVQALAHRIFDEHAKAGESFQNLD